MFKCGPPVNLDTVTSLMNEFRNVPVKNIPGVGTCGPREEVTNSSHAQIKVLTERTLLPKGARMITRAISDGRNIKITWYARRLAKIDIPAGLPWWLPTPWVNERGWSTINRSSVGTKFRKYKFVCVWCNSFEFQFLMHLDWTTTLVNVENWTRMRIYSGCCYESRDQLCRTSPDQIISVSYPKDGNHCSLCFALPEQVPIRGLELVNRVEHQGLAYAKGSIGDCYHQLLPWKKNIWWWTTNCSVTRNIS